MLKIDADGMGLSGAHPQSQGVMAQVKANMEQASHPRKEPKPLEHCRPVCHSSNDYHPYSPRPKQ